MSQDFRFTLRPAAEEDFPAIKRLIRLGRINPTALKWRRFVVVVTPEGEAVGCGQVKPHGDGSLELASVAVDPVWRKQGLARAIIEHLLMENPGILYLTCRSTIGPMYEKFGFEAIAQDEMPRYFRRISKLVGLVEFLRKEGVTLLVMRREGEGA